MADAFESSDSPERVELRYERDERMIVAGGCYEDVRVYLGDFLLRFDISAEDCRLTRQVSETAAVLSGEHHGQEINLKGLS